MSSTVNVNGDLELQGALTFVGAYDEFPVEPKLGTMILKDGCLYLYVRLGGMTTWYPFATRTHSYVHSQGVAALAWVVTHGLGTRNVWFQVKDASGQIVSVGKADLDENSFQLNFTAAITGTCVVVAPDTVDVPQVSASVIRVGANGEVVIDSDGVWINGQQVLTSGSFDAQIAAAVAPKADQSAVTAALATKADQAAMDAALAAKADQAAVDVRLNAKVDLAWFTQQQLALDAEQAAMTAALATKADLGYVDAQLATKADQLFVEQQLALEADGSYVNQQLATKADQAAMTAALAAKAGIVYVDSRLTDKADIEDVEAQLATKADQSAMTTALATKADQAAMTAALADKADQSAVEARLAAKADVDHGHAFASLTARPVTLDGYGITDAVASNAVGAANGVAALDASGRVPASQLPSYVDDVVEHADLAGFPETGEAGTLYVARDTGQLYRWTGSLYVEVSANASTADAAVRLATARTIALSGDATGTVTFDGSADVTLTVAVTDGSHNHSTANIVGLAAEMRDTAGDVVATHATATNPHPQYLTAADLSGYVLTWRGLVPVSA